MKISATVGFSLLVLTTPLAAQEPEFETVQLADGVYMFRYQFHNGLFVVTSEGVVAVDPISTEAAPHFAEAIGRVAPGQPLRAVIYSHHHGDHATGANVLREALGPDAPIIAHENARPRLVEANDPDLPPPTLTLADRMTLYFGNRTIELHYLGKSHSDNMIVVLVPDARLAFAVDFVSNDRVGYRELPDYYFPDFLGAIERLMTLEFEQIAHGHGPPGDRASIRRQGRYYAALRSAVQEAVEQGMTEDEAAEGIRLPEFESFSAYEQWFPLNVRAMYRFLKEDD